MRHYIFDGPKGDYVWVFGTDGDDNHLLEKKFIYTSRKGPYVRVNVGRNKHKRKYLDDMKSLKLIVSEKKN